MMEGQLVNSDSLGGVQPTVAVRQSALMRSVNCRMRELADTLAYDDPIIFFCECQTSSCYSPITMSAADFDAAVAGQTGWLLREGHQPSVFWEARELEFSPWTETGGSLAVPGPANHEVSRRSVRRWGVLLRRRLALTRNVADLEETAMDGVLDA
jgi:hypothetical protein